MYQAFNEIKVEFYSPKWTVIKSAARYLTTNWMKKSASW